MEKERKLRSRLSTIMGSKRLRISDVMKITGLSRNAVTGLYNDTSDRVDLDTLDRLCIGLNVTLNDLFERLPEQE